MSHREVKARHEEALRLLQEQVGFNFTFERGFEYPEEHPVSVRSSSHDDVRSALIKLWDGLVAEIEKNLAAKEENSKLQKELDAINMWSQKTALPELNRQANEITQLQQRVKELEKWLKDVLGAWRSEANEGDGIAVEHADIFHKATESLKEQP